MDPDGSFLEVPHQLLPRFGSLQAQPLNITITGEYLVPDVAYTCRLRDSERLPANIDDGIRFREMESQKWEEVIKQERKCRDLGRERAYMERVFDALTLNGTDTSHNWEELFATYNTSQLEAMGWQLTQTMGKVDACRLYLIAKQEHQLWTQEVSNSRYLNKVTSGTVIPWDPNDAHNRNFYSASGYYEYRKIVEYGSRDLFVDATWISNSTIRCDLSPESNDWVNFGNTGSLKSRFVQLSLHRSHGGAELVRLHDLWVTETIRILSVDPAVVTRQTFNLLTEISREEPMSLFVKTTPSVIRYLNWFRISMQSRVGGGHLECRVADLECSDSSLPPASSLPSPPPS